MDLRRSILIKRSWECFTLLLLTGAFINYYTITFPQNSMRRLYDQRFRIHEEVGTLTIYIEKACSCDNKFSWFM